MKNGKTILYRVYQGAMALALRVLPEKKQELVTGNGSFLKAAVILKQHGVHKVQIVTTAGTVRRGTLAPLLSELESKGIEAAVFDGVRPDPDLSCIECAAKSYRDEGCDAFLSVGGGSAIDTAKAIRIFAGKMTEGYAPHLIAIPTTSGTGSEVTSFAVIADPAAGRKYPLVSESLTPDEAILDEELVKSVPASVTADTGMDVLTHALEAYVSINNNEFSGALAEKAVEIIGQFLYRSYSSNQDTHARRKMHIASCLAGLAFNSASLGLNHGMAHQLGARFHIPHGRANAILLPHIVEYNTGIGPVSRSQGEYPACVRKYCNMARILGVNNLNEVTTVRSLISYIHFLNEEMNIPKSVSAATAGKITQEQYEAAIESMAEAALADGCTATNPRKPLKEEVMEIYRRIW